MRRTWILGLAVVALACTEANKPAAPTPRASPKPLEPLTPVSAGDAGEGELDPLYRVVALPPQGPSVPSGTTFVTLDGERALVDGHPFVLTDAKPPVVLVPVNDTYLVQVAGLLAALDDAGVEVWLKHPDAPIAVQLELRDEPAFRAWLEEAVPGKLRVIHRADGFELQTNMGKLQGGDPNGPTVPVRGGKMDLTTLQRGYQRIKARFTSAPDYCFVPSFGMELEQIARALAANYEDPDTALFPQTCLVYPRPVRDAGP